MQNQKRLPLIIVVSVILLIAFVGVGYYFIREGLIPGFNISSDSDSARTESLDPEDNKDNGHNDQDDNKEHNQEEKLDRIKFKQSEIVINLDENTDLWEFLIVDGIEKSDIIWSSDNPDEIIVSENGIARALLAGAEANITAKNIKDDREFAICKVKTENEEDLVESPEEDDNTGLEYINIYENNYYPGTRNKGYKWDNTLFYTLEEVDPNSDKDGQIYNYDIEIKQLINKETQNIIKYEIYRNPVNGIVNKIVSIEYFYDYIEITDYYYMDNGTINSIFVRQASDYDSSHAIPTNSGQRYYFHKDVLVKWRIVDEDGKQKNYILGEAEKARGGNSGTIILYDDLSQQLRKNFDEVEAKMINAAYNTYNA
ncbi:MAG: hypothetical protein GX160_09950, partial [Clostridiales bacterium]|nr:hypothetical protein [Clostridiales bacterium]